KRTAVESPVEVPEQGDQAVESTAPAKQEPTAESARQSSDEAAPQREPGAKPAGSAKSGQQESIIITRGPASGTLGSGQNAVGSVCLFSVMLALVAVVVMIFATAWLIKRFTGLSALNNRQIKVLATLPVGARERVVLVEVGEQQLLLGVTPQQINTLHAFKEPVVIPDTPATSDFAQRLQAILSKGNPQ